MLCLTVLDFNHSSLILNLEVYSKQSTSCGFNQHEPEPDRFRKEKQLELVVFHALKQMDLKNLVVTIVKMLSYQWRILILRSGIVEG